MRTEWVRVADIYDDRVERSNREYLVAIEGTTFPVWLPYSKISSKKILDYHYRKINDSITKYTATNINEASSEIYSLLCECDEKELDLMRRRYMTFRGLQLPASNKCRIFERIKQVLSDPSVNTMNFFNNLRNDILIEKLIEKQTEVRNNLKNVERQINLISDSNQYIKITNDIDFEFFPPKLKYINSYIMRCEKLPKDFVTIKCNCVDKCTHDQLCSHCVSSERINKMMAIPNPYDENGRIRKKFKKKRLIKECNDLCKCNEGCHQRVVQKGANLKLEIFRTWNGCGWGVRTLEKIPVRTFVCRYAGEVLPFEELESKNNKEYLFGIDFFCQNSRIDCEYFVDACEYGNISRFINHCCDSNLMIYGIYVNYVHVKMPEIAFFAGRDIEAGEELSINYKDLIEAMGKKCECPKCAI